MQSRAADAENADAAETPLDEQQGEPETPSSGTAEGQSRGNHASVGVGADVVERAVAEAAVEAMMRGDAKLARSIVEEYRARIEAERRAVLRQPVLTIEEVRALRRK